MIKLAAACAVFLCLVFSCAEVKKVHHFAPLPSAIPRLKITSDTTATALRMSMLDIKTVVAANIASTTFDIRFYNPNDKILEGEFEFPLADGQHITRYALDMNGSLREGVVVEKAKARIAFESTVRRKIDPGLVEKTKGNNYRTRIYPIPAKGYRRILIAVEQTLDQQSKDLLYQLPLYASDPIDSFSIKISVIKSDSKPELDENGIPALRFNKQKDVYIAEHHQTNFIADKTVAFVLPGSDKNSDVVLTENHNGQTYFYVNSRIEPKHKDKSKPSNIGLLWDISASGDKRDLQKEMDLLKQYLSRLGNATVSLVPFNISMLEKEVFNISGGNAEKLITRLKSLDYDGGTQLGAIDLTKYSFDEVLLFSDGLSTFGRQDIVLSASPIVSVTSSPSANYAYLKFIAIQTHGQFIDLGKLELAAAIKEMDGQSLQVINIAYDKSEIEDLIMQTTPVLNTGLSFAGKLKTASAEIKLELGFGNYIVITKQFTVSKTGKSDYDQVKRIWATMKISEMDMEYEKNKMEITKLGKEFSIVTQNTSLLVLDRVEDYVEHEIIPPGELQKEYFVLLKQKQAIESDKNESSLAQALDAMAGLKEWWKKDHHIRKNPVPEPDEEMQSFTPPVIVRDADVRIDTLSNVLDSGSFSLESYKLANIDSTPVVFQSDNLAEGRLDTQFFTTSGLGSNASVGYLDLSLSGNTNGMMAYSIVRDEKNKEQEVEPDIELKAWTSDASYLKTLENAAAKERMSKYFSLKKQYSNQPSFFVDAARFFIEKNEKQAGILILSNVAEMKLEDAELLRILANQLMDAGEMELAVETFNQILKMREEDPQSYRDLALAYNETGEYNKATQLLYKLILGTWDPRFGDVKAIALNEMNAIISSHPGSVNTGEIDKRFIYAMPVDVRIVIGWNTDNSDIDLWVTDPRKEKCSYQHTETEIGGKISRDVTQGYGPEEFCLRKAWKGNYSVDVNLFGDTRQNIGGPIAIKAELFTDFGKPTQKRKTINLRVTTNKEVINLGSLKFGS